PTLYSVLRAHSITSPLTLSTSYLNDPPTHKNLHSFPTRRSSDLKDCADASGAVTASRNAEISRWIKPQLALPGRLAPPRQRKLRSEEHTSELQSLRHLVCRLLLEKKKKRH